MSSSVHLNGVANLGLAKSIATEVDLINDKSLEKDILLGRVTIAGIVVQFICE